MTDLQEKAMRMALEALDYEPESFVSWTDKLREAREALRQALAQHVDSVNMSQECVDETAKCVHDAIAFGSGFVLDGRRIDPKDIYTAPPKREWVGLTDEERERATGWSVEHIESYLKEKNT